MIPRLVYIKNTDLLTRNPLDRGFFVLYVSGNKRQYNARDFPPGCHQIIYHASRRFRLILNVQAIKKIPSFSSVLINQLEFCIGKNKSYKISS